MSRVKWIMLCRLEVAYEDEPNRSNNRHGPHRETGGAARTARVWRAITVAEEFGAWFGGETRRRPCPGRDYSWADHPSGYEHLTMEIFVERLEPERYVAFRWHPHGWTPTSTTRQNRPRWSSSTLLMRNGARS